MLIIRQSLSGKHSYKVLAFIEFTVDLIDLLGRYIGESLGRLYVDACEHSALERRQVGSKGYLNISGLLSCEKRALLGDLCRVTVAYGSIGLEGFVSLAECISEISLSSCAADT